MNNYMLPGEQDFEKLVQSLASRLTKCNWSMATAESCTGGWIAKCCTDLAGSSAWFDRGFVTYSDRAKHDLLGVDFSTLKNAGAVSRATAYWPCTRLSGARRRSLAIDR